MSHQSKAVVGVLVLGVTAAIGASSVYPIYLAKNKPIGYLTPVRA
jgi:hypothetical protein